MKRFTAVLFCFTFLAPCLSAFTLKIHCDPPQVVYNDHVGNEWNFSLKIGKKDYSVYETIIVEAGGILKILFTVQEIDKQGNDYGSAALRLDLSLLEFDTEYYADLEPVIYEDRGRYSGNSAQWQLRIYYTKLREPETY